GDQTGRGDRPLGRRRGPAGARAGRWAAPVRGVGGTGGGDAVPAVHRLEERGAVAPVRQARVPGDAPDAGEQPRAGALGEGPRALLRLSSLAWRTMAKAIVGGYVVPIDGDPIEGGTVLIDGGKIVAVGTEAEVDIPEDAELVDAAGTWVLPGFFDAHAHLGVHEDGEGWAGNDTNEMTDPNGARFRAVDG